MANHCLEISRIDPLTASKARRKFIEDGADLHEGSCFCGQWAVRLGLRQEIESLFQEHVVKALGYADRKSEGEGA